MTERVMTADGVVKATGSLTAIVYDDDSMRNEIARFATPNRVMTVGRNQVRDAVFGDGITPPTRFALGTSNTAVADSQTALIGSEVWRDVFTAKTKANASIEIKYFLTSTTANGSTLREAGLFNDATGGDMYARVVFTNDIEKTSAIAVLFVWTLTWSAS